MHVLILVRNPIVHVCESKIWVVEFSNCSLVGIISTTVGCLPLLLKFLHDDVNNKKT